MRIKAVLTALQFKDLWPKLGGRVLELDLPEGTVLEDALRVLSEDLGLDLRGMLERRKMVLFHRNSAVAIDKDGQRVLREGEELLFITPLIGG